MGIFFFQAEDGIRDLVRSRGLGDVYKRQPGHRPAPGFAPASNEAGRPRRGAARRVSGIRSTLSLIHI